MRLSRQACVLSPPLFSRDRYTEARRTIPVNRAHRERRSSAMKAREFDGAFDSSEDVSGHEGRGATAYPR